MKAFLVAIVLICLIGCSRKSGSFPGLLGKEKMQAVMWDIIQADAFTEQFTKKDSLKKAPVENMQLQNKIFALHQVTRDDFYKSYDYYISHSDLMKSILDSMAAKNERDRAKTIQRHYGGQPKN
ncbi:MAG: DUF4296 domain-containing protein [Ferruginibacter sp.]